MLKPLLQVKLSKTFLNNVCWSSTWVDMSPKLEQGRQHLYAPLYASAL